MRGPDRVRERGRSGAEKGETPGPSDKRGRNPGARNARGQTGCEREKRAGPVPKEERTRDRETKEARAPEPRVEKGPDSWAERQKKTEPGSKSVSSQRPFPKLLPGCPGKVARMPREIKSA